MDKRYEFQRIEQNWYGFWDGERLFHADPAGSGDPYTIVIPPPNVTAALHLGHALNNTLQDILIRRRRMMGNNALWMPGTDHAGIATQTVVEKQLLNEQGKRRTDFSREEFVGYVRDWKDEFEARILGQLKAMGCSCDWERTRFTMDDTCARSVRANFHNLFKDGLIYRGKRLVNWDPATQTVLADDEVEHETVHGSFWNLDYPLAEPVEIDGKTVDRVTVATTRPETMLGDTAVAMNPKDPRAGALVGKTVVLPIVGRTIPIVADEHVVLPDPDADDDKAKYSTGFLKVTPAHDPDDWQIGQRHGLPVINVMAPDGTISDKHGWDDAGEACAFVLDKDRFEARKLIVDWFKDNGLLGDIRDYAHEVGHSYRSHVPIEPYLSDQWYVAVKKPLPRLTKQFGTGMIDGTDVPLNSLAGLALKPLMDGRLAFTPERYARTYQTWLENLRDWPISRQLWWGHQIPVWSSAAAPGFEDPAMTVQEGTDDEGEKKVFVCVDHDRPDLEEKLEAAGFVRDTDVLDTWFSSALWPFSTLGWPEQTPELEKYYPGSVLCTAREIITLWVSRMVMMGQYCLGDIPFSDVFIHAMIQDGEGRKMSKSLGNGIDPLVVIDSHGADAMRFTLASMTTETQDVRMPVVEMELPDGRKANTSPKFDGGRNFCNKLWNAARFVLSAIDGTVPVGDPSPEAMELADRWILSRLSRAVQTVNAALDRYHFSEAAQSIYAFLWHDYCDWYIELCKYRLYKGGDEAKKVPVQLLAGVLDTSLRLLHPFMPYLTEEIWQQLKNVSPELTGKSIMVSAWPAARTDAVDKTTERGMKLIQDVITTIRTMRSEADIPPGKEVNLVLVAADEDVRAMVETYQSYLMQLIRLQGITVSAGGDRPADALTGMAGPVEIFIPMEGLIDKDKEREKINVELERVTNGIKITEKKLANRSFVERAPEPVVQKERDKLEDFTRQAETLKQNLKQLG